VEHIKNCSKDMGNFSRSHFFQMRLECQIKETEIEMASDGRNYTNYIIQVYFNGEDSWLVK
tara:strand:+ start:753 stop:935 length:183 start_codon:yes stop_codon:yes gene_type:complete